MVLPAEYNIDPTGVGRALGLTQMGEIKTQLAREAEADRATDQAPPAAPSPAPDRRSGLLGAIVAHLLVGPAAAQLAPAAPAGSRSEAPTPTFAPSSPSEAPAQSAPAAPPRQARQVQFDDDDLDVPDFLK